MSSVERGGLLRVTDAERQSLKLWHAAAIDTTPEQLTERQRQQNAARMRKARADKGAKPRATSLMAVRLWVGLGVSRATYYRLRRAGRLPCGE